MTAVDRIAYIQTLFQQVNTTELDGTNLEKFCSDSEPEFVSVIYEAAAAQCAKKDFENDVLDVPSWLLFKEKYAAKHGSQIHVGLGWAMAECSVLSCSILSSLPSELQWRVWDGFGYYSGLFKRREAVRQQDFPQGFDAEWMPSFDQGLGRSFWYISQADPSRVESMIHLFPEERHRNLWRGVGLAMTYIGGLENALVKETLQRAGKYQSSVLCGALLALEGKEKAGVEPLLFDELRSQLGITKKTAWLDDPNFRAVLTDMESRLA